MAFNTIKLGIAGEPAANREILLPDVDGTVVVNPMVSGGDIIVGAAYGEPDALPAGEENDVLTILGGAPTWVPGGHCWDFTIINPNAASVAANKYIFIALARAALTITSMSVSCDADPATEITGDLCVKSATTNFLSLGTPTIIHAFDTTGGAMASHAITANNTVASGCPVFLLFDADPDVSIKQLHFHIEWGYD